MIEIRKELRNAVVEVILNSTHPNLTFNQISQILKELSEANEVAPKEAPKAKKETKKK